MPLALATQYISASAPGRVRFFINPGGFCANRIDTQPASWHGFQISDAADANANAIPVQLGFFPEGRADCADSSPVLRKCNPSRWDQSRSRGQGCCRKEFRLLADCSDHRIQSCARPYAE